MVKPTQNQICTAMVYAKTAAQDMSGELTVAYYAYDKMSEYEIAAFLKDARVNARQALAAVDSLFADEKPAEEPGQPSDDGSCDPLFGVRMDSADMGEC